MFLITWDDIYRSSILVRIYILIVQEAPGRKAIVLGPLSPWDKEGCLCLKSLQFLVLPDWGLILDRSYSSHWPDMRPKPRQILTSSSLKFRWSDWKGCPCSQAHVSEAIYYRMKPFASTNNFVFFLRKINYLLFFPSWRLLPLLQVPKRCSHWCAFLNHLAAQIKVSDAKAKFDKIKREGQFDCRRQRWFLSLPAGVNFSIRNHTWYLSILVHRHII